MAAASDPAAAGQAAKWAEQADVTAAVRAATLDLLDARAPGATLCPSEVARAVGGVGWRGEMAAVHAAVDSLVADGLVRLSWKGVALAGRDGPYRIGRSGGSTRRGNT